MRLAPVLMLILALPLLLLAEDGKSKGLRILGKDPSGHGLLATAQGKKILFVSGSAEQMGTAHGTLLRQEIPNVSPRTMMLVGGVYAMNKGDWFPDRIDEIVRRGAPHTPERFLREVRAMGAASGIGERFAMMANFFPELFHCSGVAVRGVATLGGEVLHVRVLDYMAEVNLQNYALLQVFCPEGYHAWVSLGYAGFLGTVTAMNERGLAMGEMGGKGEGDWDGMPMTFLMREIMERAATVREALEIIRNTPRTCEYYYVLSDKSRDMVGLYCTPNRVEVLEAGQQHDRLPPVPAECVMMSAGKRAEVLSERLHQQHGKLTPELLMEVIKRPVAMKSNLHNAIFRPETLELWVADAGRKTPACDAPYAHFSLAELLAFYRQAKLMD